MIRTMFPGVGRTIGYGYDSLGRVNAISYPDAHQIARRNGAVLRDLIHIGEANANIFIYQPMSADGGTVFSKPSLDSARTYFDEFGR